MGAGVQNSRPLFAIRTERLVTQLITQKSRDERYGRKTRYAIHEEGPRINESPETENPRVARLSNPQGGVATPRKLSLLKEAPPPRGSGYLANRRGGELWFSSRWVSGEKRTMNYNDVAPEVKLTGSFPHLVLKQPWHLRHIGLKLRVLLTH